MKTKIKYTYIKKTSFIAQKIVNLPNFIAPKYSWFTVCMSHNQCVCCCKISNFGVPTFWSMYMYCKYPYVCIHHLVFYSYLHPWRVQLSPGFFLCQNEPSRPGRQNPGEAGVPGVQQSGSWVCPQLGFPLQWWDHLHSENQRDIFRHTSLVVLTGTLR